MEYLINELTSLIDIQINYPFSLNPTTVIDLIELIAKYRKLDNFYSETKISYEDSKNIMDYSIKKIVTVFYNNLSRSISSLDNQSFNYLEANIYPLIKLLFYIYHETEHMNQDCIYYSQAKTVEASIIRATDFGIKASLEKVMLLPFGKQELEKLKLRILEYNSNYSNYCKFVPIERMAYIKAYDFVLNLITSSSYFNSLNDLYNYFNQSYFKKALEAYNYSDFPTKYYFEKAHINFSWWPLYFKISKLSLDEKVYLGLSLTEQEKSEIFQREDNFHLKLTL